MADTRTATGSVLPKMHTKVSNIKKKVEWYLNALSEANRVFNNAANILKTKILDKQLYNMPNFIGKFQFNFEKTISEINHKITEKMRLLKIMHKGDSEKISKGMESLYCEIIVDYKLDQLNLKSMKKMRFWENEVISFFIRFNKMFEGWVLDHDKLSQRKYRKINWNAMQVAKSMEKCLFSTIGMMMTHLATGETHCSKILMLNDIGHENQIKKNLAFVNAIFGNVEIGFDLGDDLSAPCWNQRKLVHYNADVRNALETSSIEEDDDLVRTMSDTLNENVFRRGKGRKLSVNLVNFIKLCIERKVYCQLVLDESQNATGTMGVYHRFMMAIMDPEHAKTHVVDALETAKDIEITEDEAELLDLAQDENFVSVLHNEYVRAEYWTATPPHHYGTKADHCYGVVGNKHTGIHCVNGQYIKNVNGVYMNEPSADGRRPNIITFEDLQDSLGFTRKCYNPSAYQRSDRFDAWKRRAQKLGHLSEDINNHDEYRQMCHEMFATIIETVVASKRKTDTTVCLFPEQSEGWIAMRVTRNNRITHDVLIPGIQAALNRRYRDKVVMDTYNHETRRRSEYQDIDFDLKECCSKLMRKPENRDKALVMFFTAKGRCGDQFPSDFQTFLEVPGMLNNDMTVNLQAFFGRSCGYFKGIPDVILPEHQAEMLRSYMRHHGIIEPRYKSKNCKTDIQGRSLTVDVYKFNKEKPVRKDFKLVNRALRDALLDIERDFKDVAAFKQDELRNGLTNYANLDKLQNFITIANSIGYSLADTNDFLNGYKSRRGAFHRHTYFDPSKPRPEEVKINNRGCRSDGITPTGQVNKELVFMATLVWARVWNDSGTVAGRKLIGLNLLVNGPWKWQGDPNEGPTRTSYNESQFNMTAGVTETDPNKSCMAHTDGQVGAMRYEEEDA
jgi:hypothetical protein